MSTVLAIDLGTQSLRHTLASHTGETLWTYSQPVASRVGNGLQEQDARAWRELLIGGLVAAARQNRAPDIIVAGGPLAGFVPLGPQGDILGPAVLYNDTRSESFLAEVDEGRDDFPPRSTIADPLPHALRLRDADRDLFSAMRHFLDATGFLNFVLCGATTLNSFTALRLPHARRAQLGLSGVPFGSPVATGQIIGELRPDLASLAGWPAVPIAAAPFDSKCAYLGSGITAPGEALDISGTVTSFGTISDREVTDTEKRIYSVPFGSSWLVRGSTAAAGSVIEWARALMGVSIESYDAMAMGDITADAPLVIPFHSGARAPLWQPRARGLAIGLDLATDRAALARATYLGLALSLRHIVETVEANGGLVRTLRLAGGLAKSPVLSQLKADILDRPTVALAQTELTTTGLVAIGATALGLYPDIATAADALTHDGPHYAPRVRRHVVDQLYQRYLDAAAFALPTGDPEPPATTTN